MQFRLRMNEAATLGSGKFLDRHGRTDAVAFVRQATGASHPGIWRAGVHIKTAAQGSILRGTAIATFNAAGFYPNDERGYHAAIYLSHDQYTLRVLDQWPTQGEVRQRVILFEVKPGTIRPHDANTYYVIE
jgi:hypothetical protein